ncbi:hypothetical protein ES705_35401 [subsurface metagenome]
MIYICDTENDKIVIYDLDLRYLRSIGSDKKSRIYGVSHLKFDRYNNIIGVAGHMGLVKFDSDGNELFHILANKLPRQIRGPHNFFPYKENILFYDDRGNIKSIDKKGGILNEVELKKIIANLNKEASGILRQDAVLVRKINDFVHEKNLIMKGDRLLTTNITKHREYFRIFKDIKSVSVTESKLNIDVSSLGLWSHIGFDSDDNIYWNCKRNVDERGVVVIYSKYGEIIEAFYNDVQRSRVSVAPNGDVYFMNFDETGTHFWKTERRW